MWSLAGVSWAGAAGPLPDRYEPNDSAVAATPVDPDTRYAATISPAGESDWFAVVPGAPRWQTAIAAGRRTVQIGARRLEPGCAESSLRITAFAADGAIITSGRVFPGAEAGAITFDLDPAQRIDLLVDTELDPSCAVPVEYEITAYPFAPRSVGTSQLVFHPDAAKCGVARRDKRQIQRTIKSAATKQLSRRRRARRIKGLSRRLKTANARIKASCPRG